MAITYLSGQRVQGLSNASGGSALFEGSENAQNTSVPVLGAGEFTVACWIYPTANDAYNHFISSYSSGAGDNWALLTKAGVVEFYNQSDTQPSSSITIAIDTWHHVAIKRDSSDALFFVVDGVVVDPSVTRTTSYGGTTFSVGGLVGASGQNFDGNISDVAYWDKAISDAKLQAIYNDKTLAGDTDSGDLVAYFPLSSDFTDSKASYDLTNNGGTITSTTWELNEREKVTDVPTGSQFEETDTRKFYQRLGKIAGTSGTGSAFADITRYDSENDAVSFDLGSNLSDTQWTLRFKFVIDSITRSSSTSGRSFWGMSSADANTTANSNQDSICFGITYGSDSGEDQFRAYNSNGSAMEDAFANIGSSMLATGTWYVTVDRTTATNQTVSVTTNSDYTTSATSASDSILSTLEDLRYFVVKTKTGSTENNHIYCNVQDVKIWNATNDTSGSPTYTPDMSITSGWVIKNSSRVNVGAWTERGTAI